MLENVLDGPKSVFGESLFWGNNNAFQGISATQYLWYILWQLNMANIDFADTPADMGRKFGECMGDINYTVK